MSNEDKTKNMPTDGDDHNTNEAADRIVADGPIGTSNKHFWKRRLAAFSGTFFEWYDFSALGYFSDIIGEEFFPYSHKTTLLALSFTVFASAFFARPFGSIILGRLGDKYGPKTAIEISIICMGLSSFFIGCLPTYHTAGWFAPIMLIILRCLQGLSVGGHYIASILFSMEGGYEKRRGFQTSIARAVAIFGFVCGNALSALLREVLSVQQLHDFGWRIPFWIGILACTSGLYLKYIVESQKEVEGFDSLQHLKDSFNKQNIVPMLCYFATSVSVAVVPYIAFVWSIAWMDILLDPPVKHAYIVTTIASLFSGVILQPLLGIAVDKLDKNAQIVISTNLFSGAFFPLVLYLIKKTRNPVVAFVVLFIIGINCSLQIPAMFCYFHDKFPPSTKVTAMSFSYNMCLAIFGGTATTVSTIISQLNSLAPGYFITATCIVSVTGIILAMKYTTTYSEHECIDWQNDMSLGQDSSDLSTPLLDRPSNSDFKVESLVV